MVLEDDDLFTTINGLHEHQLRYILQHIATVQPDAVRLALAHVQQQQQQQDDMFSLDTEQISNTTSSQFIPPVPNNPPRRTLQRTTSGGGDQPEQSKRRLTPHENALKQTSFDANNAESSYDSNDEANDIFATTPTTTTTAPVDPTTGPVHRLQRRRPSEGPDRVSSASSVVSTGNASSSPTNASSPPTTSNPNAVKAFLIYNSDSAKLMLQYSKTHVTNAMAVFESPHIKPFKLTQNFGRFEIIGNCASGVAGRKNYYSGWCQFLRMAQLVQGTVRRFFIEEQQQNNDETTFNGLPIDLYMYLSNTNSSWKILNRIDNNMLDMSDTAIVAVACFPKHANFYHDGNQVDLVKWMDDANNKGGVGTTLAATTGQQQQQQQRGNSKSPRVRKAILSSPTPNVGTPITTSTTASSTCFLFYDADSLGQLYMLYSKRPMGPSPGVALVAKFVTHKKVPSFKFKSKTELTTQKNTGGVAGRKLYYSAICQFIKAAHAMMPSEITLYPYTGIGLPLDIHLFHKGYKTTHALIETSSEKKEKEEEDGPNHIPLVEAAAVCCLPKHTKFYDETLSVDLVKWMTEASSIGAASRF